ncbi:MAG: hypothetical protein ACI4DX_01525 [Oliverpabstia sp.]
MCYNEITKTIKAQGEYIFGHLFGAVGAVISKSNRFFCIPLKINIQDGLQSAAGWEGSTVSTDFTLTAVQIIELYSKRFCIENCFREMKQQTGAFCYHCWTKTLEKLNHFKKKEAPDALEKVTDLKAQRRIIKKVQSIEVFVQISCIAFGILQLLAVQEATEGDLSTLFYTRTKAKSRVSEARVRWYLGWRINHLLLQNPDSFITEFIRERQMK